MIEYTFPVEGLGVCLEHLANLNFQVLAVETPMGYHTPAYGSET
jgi:hypothetical protein